MAYGFFTTGGKRGRVGYHTWDQSIAQAFSKEYIIVSEISVAINKNIADKGTFHSLCGS